VRLFLACLFVCWEKGLQNTTFSLQLVAFLSKELEHKLRNVPGSCSIAIFSWRSMLVNDLPAKSQEFPEGASIQVGPVNRATLSWIGWAMQVPKKEKRHRQSIDHHHIWKCVLGLIKRPSAVTAVTGQNWAVDRWCSTDSRASRLGRHSGPSNSWLPCTCVVVKRD